MNRALFKTVMERMYRRGRAPWETGLECAELERRLAAGELPAAGSALDLGCGTGVQSLQLAAHGLDTVGIDVAETAIEAARTRAADHPAGARVRFIAADLADVRDVGEPFDVLLDRGCYHLARGHDLPGYLDTLRRLSRRGTRLVLLAASSEQTAAEPGLPVVSEAELRNELSEVFEVLDLRRCRLAAPPGADGELFWSVLLERDDRARA